MRQTSEVNLISFDDIGQLIDIKSGNFNRHKLSIFSIFRNEVFFVNAFFDHYRKLGIEQFLILDDGSDDSTSEYLAAQADCVVLNSPMTYGQPIRILNRDGKIRDIRAGIFFKMAAPNYFFQDNFVLYVDADEFLFLPSEVESLPMLCDILKAENEKCVAASIVEFFPENIKELGLPLAPRTIEDLIERYPYFQSEPVIGLGGKKGVGGRNPSKSTRLFEQFDVRFDSESPPIITRLMDAIRGRKKKPFRKTPKVKIPLLFCSEDSYLTGTHEANNRVSQKILLTIAHFVFTYQMSEKIKRARKWRSYASNSVKYDLYQELLEKMSEKNASFVDDQSEKFSNVNQFTNCGLMSYKK